MFYAMVVYKRMKKEPKWSRDGRKTEVKDRVWLAARGWSMRKSEPRETQAPAAFYTLELMTVKELERTQEGEQKENVQANSLKLNRSY